MNPERSDSQPESRREAERFDASPRDFAVFVPRTINEFEFWLSLELRDFEARWSKLAAPRSRCIPFRERR